MLSRSLQAISQFEWCSPHVAERPDTLLMAEVFWWERRENVLDHIARLKNTENDIQASNLRYELWFCLAYAALSTGQLDVANPFIDRLETEQPESVLVLWLKLEKQGRSRNYKGQAATLVKIIKGEGVLPDWAATACFASLNHNGLDAKPLLTVLARQPIATALGGLLFSRLQAAIGQTKGAIETLTEAHKRWPRCAALPWFQGLLFAQIGKSEHAIGQINKAEELGLTDMTVLRYWLATVTSKPRNITKDDIFAVHNRITKYVHSDARQSAELSSCLIIRHWMDGNLPAAYQLLVEHHAFQDMKEQKVDRAAQVFMRYAVFLCVAWQHNQALYLSNEMVPLLNIIGESHSLAASNVVFTWQGRQVRGNSCFVMGGKMWHFANPDTNEYKIRLAEQIESLTSTEPLLFTIGEIDCRPEEGIWSAHRKTGRPLKPLIKKTVQGYLDFLKQKLSGKGFASITVQGVPAPGYKLEGNRDPGDRQEFLAMIKEVNKQLMEGAHARGWSFLDVYSATAADDGTSNRQWHLDNWHLHPAFYANSEKFHISPL